jgi:NAD(P)-dependent dehydrogenase (short-subunit alcohol dehydrogenase family)
MAAKSLAGKVALVTGAGTPIGLGRHIALALAREGARVAMLDINESGLEQAAADVRAESDEASVLPLVADVTDPESVEEAVERTVAELGGLDIVFNNAGTNPVHAGLASAADGHRAWEISVAAWQRTVGVNLSGPFYVMRAVVPRLVEQGWGRIVGVTTSMDTMWRRGSSPYGPSKAGHEALMAILSQELEGTGVTANVLVPGGATYTGMTEGLIDREAMIQASVMEAPALWLASDDSADFTGRRIIAYNWNEDLPLEDRLEQASAPTAWPQLGRQAVIPGTDSRS